MNIRCNRCKAKLLEIEIINKNIIKEKIKGGEEKLFIIKIKCKRCKILSIYNIPDCFIKI
ncbi:hypothetical protein ABSA28_01139 [Candidatus Hepatincolaceae symbiont of Richtersius coronifer]